MEELKNKLLEEIHIQLEERDVPLSTIVLKAARLARITGDKEYQMLFELHLDGAPSEREGTRVRQWHDPNVQPKWYPTDLFYQDRSVSADTSQGLPLRQLEDLLVRTRETLSRATAAGDINARATLIKTEFEVNAIMGRIRNRIAAFIGEVEDTLLNQVQNSSQSSVTPDTSLMGKIDFAILTVREDENKAILKRFPGESIYEGRHRSYSISRVPLGDEDYYLVAVVRSVEQGEGHGQDVARDAIEDLDPQWLLLSGIAGGVPASEYTLGDVVAALRLTDFSVRAVMEGRSTQYAVAGGPMHKHVQDRLALIPAMADRLGDWSSAGSIGMGKPPVELDRDKFYGDDEWRNKVESSLTRHFGPTATPRGPLVTTGAIVSSDTLVKDSETLKQWQQAARQVVAVEMELGGVYIAARRREREYPILAIRGISDIVGYERHPDWTEYACQSAAAFAHAFILTKPIPSRASTVKEIQGGARPSSSPLLVQPGRFARVEKLMPELVSEIKKDLSQYPLRREFVVLKKSWSYWARGEELVYYYEDHPELDGKLRVLDNLGLIREITYNEVIRYIITEEFADYLIEGDGNGRS
jgi:nucleoside phosphorylase